MKINSSKSWGYDLLRMSFCEFFRVRHFNESTCFHSKDLVVFTNTCLFCYAFAIYATSIVHFQWPDSPNMLRVLEKSRIKWWSSRKTRVWWTNWRSRVTSRPKSSLLKRLPCFFLICLRFSGVKLYYARCSFLQNSQLFQKCIVFKFGDITF